MYKTVFEWATRNGYGNMAANLARFFDEGGHNVNNRNVWKMADMWAIRNGLAFGLDFPNAAQDFSNWLKEATTNRW